MKFVVSSSELLDRLQSINKVMASKPIVEVLNNLLFSVKDGKLTLMGTDLQTTLVAELPLTDVAEEGAVAVSRKIMDPLSVMPDQPITITSKEEEKLVEVKYATGHYDVPFCDEDEFPIIPADKGTTQFSLDAAVLNESINRTFFAIGNDEMRPAMNGIYFDIHNESLVFVATDAHKLVRYTRNDIKAGTEASFILPKKSAGVLKTILPKETDSVSISFNDENVSFTLPNYRLVCRLIEGKFPAYNSVIPQDSPNKAILNRANLLTVVRRVSTMAPPETLLVKFAFENNQVNVSAQDVGFSYNGEEYVDCSYDGTTLAIGFRAAYLVEMLQCLTSQEVSIEMLNPERAGLILPVEETTDTEETLMLLMPIRIEPY